MEVVISPIYVPMLICVCTRSIHSAEMSVLDLEPLQDRGTASWLTVLNHSPHHVFYQRTTNGRLIG